MDIGFDRQSGAQAGQIKVEVGTSDFCCFTFPVLSPAKRCFNIREREDLTKKNGGRSDNGDVNEAIMHPEPTNDGGVAWTEDENTWAVCPMLGQCVRPTNEPTRKMIHIATYCTNMVYHMLQQIRYTS